MCKCVETDCKHRIYRRAYDKRRTAAQPHYRKNDSLKYYYGITLAEFDDLWIEQGGMCAICKQPDHNDKLHVDHNHLTGKIRGLLCHHCNSGLGLFRDSPNILNGAIEYLSI